MRPRRPTLPLDALLDALEADILAASDAEIRAALRETGRLPSAAAQEVRTVLEGRPATPGRPRTGRANTPLIEGQARRH